MESSIPVRSGGSIPIVPMFEEVLGLKTILLGFGLDSDVIHSPNEHFGCLTFIKVLKLFPHFYKNYASLMSNKMKNLLLYFFDIFFMSCKVTNP